MELFPLRNFSPI